MLQQMGFELSQRSIPPQRRQSSLQAKVAQAEAMTLAEQDFQLPQDMHSPEGSPREVPTWRRGIQNSQSQLAVPVFADGTQPAQHECPAPPVPQPSNQPGNGQVSIAEQG